MKKIFGVSVIAVALLAACSSNEGATTSTEGSTPAEEVTVINVPGNIADVARSNGEFSTLVAALTAAGLVEILQGDELLTVFAPTDAAFANLPAGLLEKLLLPENEEILIAILTYHVVSGRVTSAELESGEILSNEGSPLSIFNNGFIRVNSANVVLADVEASNGVLHVLDTVLVPPSIDLTKI